MTERPREDARGRPDEPAPPPCGKTALPACHIAGIGASAGCIEALRRLFTRVPADSGLAWVVVVHLSPEHESHLAEILQPQSRMPVHQVTRTTMLEPNAVYVIPPNANLSAIDSHLRLSDLEGDRRARAPIDHFFCTLAAAHQSSAVGVLLTGTGSDGSLGLRRIKERGGLTIAQDPAEAEFDSMPRNAIAAGAVDMVREVDAIADEIMRFCATRPRLPANPEEIGLTASELAVLEGILAELRDATGHDPSVYRRGRLLGRIRHRMQLCHVETLAGYLEVVRQVPGEVPALLSDLSLTVAEFFEDPDVVRSLEQEILPRLFTTLLPGRDRLRVWIIRCATGEEAYSLAMLLLEEGERRNSSVRLQVFASDISDTVLDHARTGIFTEEACANVSPGRLARFFRREGEHYVLCRAVRDLVVFTRHDLLRDPPFSSIDLVVCRNLLSDLEPTARRQVLSRLAYALDPRGSLLLGPEERLDEKSLFQIENEAVPLYRRRVQVVWGGESVFPSYGSTGGSAVSAAIAHDRMIRLHGAPSVLLHGETRQVAHYSPSACRFIRFPGGEPTRDILRLVLPSMQPVLAAGLARVAQARQPWRSGVLSIETEEGPMRIALRLVPERCSAPEGVGFTLLLFEELESWSADQDFPRTGELVASLVRLTGDLEQARERVNSLMNRPATAPAAPEGEPANARAELRAVLEASRAELQAAHEELVTLDQENRRQLEQLKELTSDLQHCLASTGIASLFLDRDLAIVRFTPQAAELFHLRQSDRGRPLLDIAHGLDYPQLVEDARGVLMRQQPFEREVQSEDGRWHLARILPYRNALKEIGGVVVTLVDTTARRRAEEELREADRRKDEFLATLAHELRNPLAPIVAGIGVLRMTSSNQAHVITEITAMMERQAKQLVRLVDDLLEVSRITRGRLQLCRTDSDVADILQDAVAATRPQIDAAGHELTVRLPDERLVLAADPVRLTQAVANLLTNAARYTPPRGHIALSASCKGDDVLIVVQDDGVGIPADMLQRIFEPFTQLAQTRQTPNSGLGIGLTLARSLVEMHGGRLTATSAGPGKGSTFTMRLPMKEAGHVEEVVEIKPVPRKTGERSILVVDDNVDAAESLGLLLSTLGHSDVRTASSGEEALRSATERHPEIMFVDLNMPLMDGHEVARRIRAETWGSDVFLVALSGWGQEERPESPSDADFDQYITKPADSAALKDVLETRTERLR